MVGMRVTMGWGLDAWGCGVCAAGLLRRNRRKAPWAMKCCFADDAPLLLALLTL